MPKAPKTPKPSNTAMAQLARLPYRSDIVIEGGIRPLGIYVRENKQTIQSHMVMWLDVRNGYILASQPINPQAGDGTAQALDVLVTALTAPFPAPEPQIELAKPKRAAEKDRAHPPAAAAPQPGLPATIRVNDAALAEAARELLEPLHVTVEHAEHMPVFDAAFESISAYLGADPTAQPPEPFRWDVDLSVLPGLFKAAAGYWRRSPWEYMLDHPPLAVVLGEHGPEPGVDTLYASILGAAGTVTGIAFYYSLDAFQEALRQGAALPMADEDLDMALEMLRAIGAPVDQISREDLRDELGSLLGQSPVSAVEPSALMQESLAFFLDSADEADPTYLEWLKDHNLKYPSREAIPVFLRVTPESEPRQPNEREVKALTLAIEALNQFFTRSRQTLEELDAPPERLTYQARVGAGPDKQAISVSFPAPGYEWSEQDSADWFEAAEALEEPEMPPSEAGQATVYRFQVKLQYERPVSRRIEMRGDQTLNDLHMAIQRAFEWDNDHLYAFFLSGKAWDDASAYESPYSDGRNAARYRLEHLPLKQGQTLLYIFDFGDEWRHKIKLEAIVPDGVQKDIAYPRITEAQGEPAPQYPAWE